MKINRTIPTNWNFFREHGVNYAAYGLIGLMGQVLSGLSLLYAVYSLVLAKMGLTEGSLTTRYLVVALAGTVALFVELANRKLARPSIKPWVQKDLFVDDPEARDRHQILTRSYRIILFLVAALSYILSAIGSVEYAEDSAPPPLLIDTDSLELVFGEAKQEIQHRFAADTALLAPVFKLRLQAAHDAFTHDSLALMKERSRYQGCARKGNAWCKTQLTTYLAKIDQSRKALADSVAMISREKMAAFRTYQQNRDGQLQVHQREREGDLSRSREANAQLLNEQEQDAGLKGLIFILLTIAGQTIFYLMVYLQLQIEAGSGIEHELEPNEFWDRPSLLNELNSTLIWRVERGARRVIGWIFSEPDQSKSTRVPYWVLKRDQTPSTKEEETVEQSSNSVSCSVKGTGKQSFELADAKSKLSIYKKRVGRNKQKARDQLKKKGEVSKRTQNAIANNERWVEYWTAEVKRLSRKAAQLNGQKV